MVASLLRMAGLDWTVPDHTTLCRRQKTLAVQIPYRRADGPLNLLIDSTGIKFLGAGWHVSRNLVVPPGMTLVVQPPYSPELNPVERVWLYLRERFLSLRLLHSAQAIIDACCDASTRLVAEPDRIKSLCSYPWIMKVASWTRRYKPMARWADEPRQGQCSRICRVLDWSARDRDTRVVSGVRGYRRGSRSAVLECSGARRAETICQAQKPAFSIGYVMG